MPIRNVWIISKETEITKAVIKTAKANDCKEIAKGIPSYFADNITEDMLPCIGIEIIPESPPEPIRNLDEEIDALTARVEKLEQTNE